MKIGFVIGSLGRGGAEMHLSQVLPELKARGHDVSIFVTGPRGPVAEQLAAAGIAIFPDRPVETPHRPASLLGRLRRHLRLALRFLPFAFRHRRGILHFFLPEAIIFGGLLTIAWHRRLVVSQRGLFTYRLKYPPVVTWLERLVRRKASVVLANSQYVARMLEQDGVPASRIRVIYNGLARARMDPVDADRQRLRAGLDMDPQTLVIISVANLFPYKGHADLLAALHLLNESGRLKRKWLLVCVGRDVDVEGHELGYGMAESHQKLLLELARNCGLQSHVRFLGDRADAPSLLRAADLAVLASHEEGFSNALIEKMAAALPIVATTVGGNPEALAEGAVGLLVPPHDPLALAEAIAKLLDSPREAAELGRLARVRALDRFSLGQCVDGYEMVYGSLFHNPHTGLP